MSNGITINGILSHGSASVVNLTNTTATIASTFSKILPSGGINTITSII